MEIALGIVAIIVTVLIATGPAIWKWLHRPLFIPGHAPHWKPEHRAIWENKGFKEDQLRLAIGEGQAAHFDGEGHKRLCVGFLSMREVRAKTKEGEAYFFVKL